MTDARCPVCGSERNALVTDTGAVPVFCNQLCRTKADAVGAQKAIIRLSLCQECGHAYNSRFDASLVSYGVEYENSLHFSPHFQKYANALAAELTELAARVRRDAEQREQRTRLETELPEAERMLAAAETEWTAAQTARHELLRATGCADAAAIRGLAESARHWHDARERVRRLQSPLDEAIDATDAAEVMRAELVTGDQARWDARLEDADTRLTDVHARLDGAARRRLAAEQCLQEARTSAELADLQLEREELIATLGEAAREWKLRVLAAALLETALDEYERAGRRELLEDASRTLATLTKGQYTGIARSEAQAAGLSLVDRDGRRVPMGAAELNGTVREHVQVSLLLSRAAQLVRRGSSLPFVLDDVLGPLPQDDAQLVAREIASLARAHPVFYLSTAEQRRHILSAMPGDVTVVEVD